MAGLDRQAHHRCVAINKYSKLYTSSCWDMRLQALLMQRHEMERGLPLIAMAYANASLEDLLILLKCKFNNLLG